MRVLVACEYSGAVRDAFLSRGHDAMSCDLLPTESPGPHHQGNVLDILDDGWDLMIAHPPCTHLAVSGARWFPDKRVEQEEACYWLKGLPLLEPTDIVEGREARVHKLPPSKDRWKLRSTTLPGIAAAMADQWGLTPFSIGA